MDRVVGAETRNGSARVGHACRICNNRDLDHVLTLAGIPCADGVLWPTMESARAAPRGDIDLVFCRRCGYVGNQAFDPTAIGYGRGYDASLHHSPLYERFILALAERLVERYDLRRRTIVDIGCGNGDFLRTLCRAGQSRGIGFDPSLRDADAADTDGGQLTFVRDFFSTAHTLPAIDFVSCRHVLTSLDRPLDFLRMVRQAMGDRPGVAIYLETPNAECILRDSAVWNLSYEHCTYLTVASFSRLARDAGFEVVAGAPCFEEQYVAVEAVVPGRSKKADPADAPGDDLRRAIAAFAATYDDKVSAWRERLREMERDGKRVIAWGAGGRAVSFFTALQIERQIAHVVDINPAKQGTFLPGTGQEIVAPAAAPALRPDVIIATNSAFEAEIREQVHEMGLHCDVVSI